MTTPSIWETAFFSYISAFFAGISKLLKMTSLGRFFNFLRNSLFPNIIKSFRVLYNMKPIGFIWRMVFFGCIFAAILAYLNFFL